jgi:hypothetical protein
MSYGSKCAICSFPMELRDLHAIIEGRGTKCFNLSYTMLYRARIVTLNALVP